MDEYKWYGDVDAPKQAFTLRQHVAWFLEYYVFTLPFLLTAVFGLLFGLAWMAVAHQVKQRPALYAAYCKLNDCRDLTLEDFVLLHREGLLPGQQSQGLSTGEAAAIGMAVGAATGAAAGGRR